MSKGKKKDKEKKPKKKEKESAAPPVKKANKQAAPKQSAPAAKPAAAKAAGKAPATRKTAATKKTAAKAPAAKKPEAKAPAAKKPEAKAPAAKKPEAPATKKPAPAAAPAAKQPAGKAPAKPATKAPAAGKTSAAKAPAAPAKPADAKKPADQQKPGKGSKPQGKGKAAKGEAGAGAPVPAALKKLLKGRGGAKLPTDPALLAKELARRARIAAAKAAKKARPPEPEEDEDEEDEAEGEEGVLADDDMDEEEGGEDEEELPEGGGDLDQREVLLHDALRSQRQRDYAAAERYINRFIELYPDDLRGLVHLGNMKRARGDREGALEAYRSALRRDRDNPLALWSKADFHLSDQANPDIGEAQDALKRIVQVWGRKRDDASQKWAEQARDKLRYCESRKYSLESRRWLQGKGTAPPNRKSLEKAKELLTKALNVYPADPRNHMNLGSVFLQLGQPQHTIERCREAIRIHPGYARAHLILGYAHRRLGQLRQAKDAFLQCIELDRQQRDVAEAWKARREVEQELARFRRRFYNALSGKPGEDGEAEQLDLHRLKEWVSLLEGDPVETADLTADPRGGYVLTAHGQRSVYKAWPGPEGLVLERQ